MITLLHLSGPVQAFFVGPHFKSAFASDFSPPSSLLVNDQSIFYLFLLLMPWFYRVIALLQSIKQFLLLPSLFFPLLPWLEEWVCFIVLERIFSDSFWVQIIKKLPVWNVDFCLFFVSLYLKNSLSHLSTF